ncbi:MAG: KpsF/GutQ family sugar-phosphate isomerase [Planctomycetota bacterium]|nr:MAG: KpsF/GutQ family sugar-phosphate isomerase [Planctomycetota bacterium]
MEKSHPKLTSSSHIDLEYAREVLSLEGEAILQLRDRIDNHFQKAVEMVLECTGQVILSGMGKCGFVGQKISATFASTGTRSVYIHPAEAVHGDLGRITGEDLVILLSRSGNTEEIVRLINPIKTIGAKMIGMTCNLRSTLAEFADEIIFLGNIQEACPLRLAPSTSTTAMLAMGDALALTVLKHKNFSKEQFALYHPAGSLGRKLLKVHQVMRTGEECAIVFDHDTIKTAILAISKAKAGAAICTNKDGILTGIFTDGDLRRYISRKNPQVEKDLLLHHMTQNPKKIGPSNLASEALKIMKEFKIGELPVVDSENKPIGVVNLKDLPKMEVF